MLKGKTAIITGTARGIGKATLEVFAENGADIYAHARKETPEFLAELARLSKEHNVEIRPFCFDLTDNSAMKARVKDIAAAKRPVDILINNAGMVEESASFIMTSAEKMKSVFEVNFFAQMMLTQYIVRLMTRQSKGSIINISSIAAIDGEPGQLEYNAGKAALIGATRKLAGELAPFGIRVNAIAPGIVETDMSGKIRQELKEQILERTFMKRIGLPREIAGAALFFASELSSYVTGQILRVDGGM